ISHLILVLILASLAPPLPQQRSEQIDDTQRDALIAFYTSTNGQDWIKHDGWLGLRGTECRWYGVICGRDEQGQLVVQDLELPDNGIHGAIPDATRYLSGLKRLNLEGNPIGGTLPGSLINRWDQGLLEVRPPYLIHDVQFITLIIDNPSVQCSSRWIQLSDGGNVTATLTDCRGNPSRTAGCTYRQGTTQ